MEGSVVLYQTKRYSLEQWRRLRPSRVEKLYSSLFSLDLQKWFLKGILKLSQLLSTWDLEDVKALALNFVLATFVHVKRQGNAVADKLAKASKTIPCPHFWSNGIPSDVQ